jgi:hypothetical protein
MANKVLVQEIDGLPAQITFADFGGDFNPTAANDLRHASAVDVECQVSLASLADGAARQSAKVDLGANRASDYHVRCAFELAATPTAGDVIELYWAPSQHATAGTGNPGGVTGADAAYTGYSANLAAAVKQLVFIGVFVCTAQATATVQVAEVGIFAPPERYGSLVIKNESNAALHSDDVESHVVFDPIVPEIQ